MVFFIIYVLIKKNKKHIHYAKSKYIFTKSTFHGSV